MYTKTRCATVVLFSQSAVLIVGHGVMYLLHKLANYMSVVSC